MLEKLREEVLKANKMLQSSGLVKLTWGNVSGIDDDSQLVVIKPSGVEYEKLSAQNLVIVDLDGNVIEGEMNPSSDTTVPSATCLSLSRISTTEARWSRNRSSKTSRVLHPFNRSALLRYERSAAAISIVKKNA